jgi:hypothetical protein
MGQGTGADHDRIARKEGMSREQQVESQLSHQQQGVKPCPEPFSFFYFSFRGVYFPNQVQSVEVHRECYCNPAS